MIWSQMCCSPVM